MMNPYGMQGMGMPMGYGMNPMMGGGYNPYMMMQQPQWGAQQMGGGHSSE